MTGSRRLLSWLGAGMIVVAGAPAAQAAASAASAGVQPRAAADCGSSAQDFDGGFRDAQYPEVGFLFDTTNAGTVTVFYRGEAIDQGTAQAANGVLTWTADGSTYTSGSIDCTDQAQPARVTAVVANSADGSDQIPLIR